MKYVVRQKVFSIGDKYEIKDESGAGRFQVRGKVISIGNKLALLDMEGKELYAIRQKLVSILPRYRLLRDGTPVAEVRKRLSLFKSRFTISGASGDYSVVGRPLGYEYSISKDGAEVATVSKRFFSMADSYGVDIAEGEDAAFILALVVVIDQVAHEGKSD